MTRDERRSGLPRNGARALLLALAVVGLWGAGAALAEAESADAGAINQRLYEQLGDAGGAEAGPESGRIEHVSGQLYLSKENLEASVISEALAEMLDRQQGQGGEEAVAIARAPRLNFEIRFDKNSAQLSDEARAGLDELGRVLDENYVDMQFILGGHTDSDGDDAVNGPLSQARADAARSYLIERHEIAPDRLVARGFGTSDPLREVEQTLEDKLYNRRVDLRPLRDDR